MNIERLIKLCTACPGVSLNQADSYPTLYLKKGTETAGKMTFISLFPGITLAYISIHSEKWPAPQLYGEGSEPVNGPLIVNFCVSGRCEITLDNQNFVYLKDGDFSLTERFASQSYVYPRSLYEGLEFFMEPELLNDPDCFLQKEYGIRFSRLIEDFCPNGKTYISSPPKAVIEILKKLWLLPLDLPASFFKMKIYTLELFSALTSLTEIPSPQTCVFFTETQVDIAKKTAEMISKDLRQHYPARELAETFGVSETSLKNYFRGVFGENISFFLRRIRMEKAAGLLTATSLPVSEIAEQVGYLNQSKFSSVFKKYFSCAPLEYRRQKRLE